MTEKPWLDIGPLDPRIRVDDRLDRLLSKLERGTSSDENGKDAALELIDHFLAVVRKRHGLHRGRQRTECLAVERHAVWMLWTSKQLEPVLERVRKALDHIPAGEAEATRRQLEELLSNPDELLSEIQRNKANSSRKPSALSREISEILKRNLDQTWRDVLLELERRVGNGVIVEVNRTGDEGVIVYNTGSFDRARSPITKPLSVATLPNTVGILKQKIRNQK